MMTTEDRNSKEVGGGSWFGRGGEDVDVSRGEGWGRLGGRGVGREREVF
jgi:hypothetical protein